MEFNHIPVLLDECLEGLNIRPDGIYCDGTAGGAGHSREIAKRLDGEKGGRLVAIDRDPEAVKTATERLAGYPATVVRGNYSEIDFTTGSYKQSSDHNQCSGTVCGLSYNDVCYRMATCTHLTVHHILGTFPDSFHNVKITEVLPRQTGKPW